MPVKLKEGVLLLLDTVKNAKRHQDYDHVVKVADDFTIYATGHNIEKKLRRFTLRETEEAFKQRVRLTQCNTPDIANSVRKPLEKVGRTPANISFDWSDKELKEDGDSRRKLLEYGSTFWGEKSFEKYIAKRLPELDSTDPNTFVIIEFKEDFDPINGKTEAPKPYPFEANSAEAINFKYKNNILQWLVVLNYHIMLDDKGQEHQGETYYMYVDNETIKGVEIHRTTVDAFLQANRGTVLVTEGNFLPEMVQPKGVTILYQIGEDSEKARYFVLNAYEHGVGRVPARRVGSLTDTVTRERTCVPIINPSKSYLEKSIKTMSEFDLTNCLHVFPRLVMYADACEGSRGASGEMIGCMKGLTPGGATCPVCQGSGFKVHTSAQDVVQVRMPRDMADLKSLEDILVYKNPPIDLLEFQQAFAFDKLREAAISAVYNHEQRRTTKTATETEMNLEEVYDALQPYADNYSDFYTWGYHCLASINDMDKGLTIKHVFPSDFKFQTLESLLDELAKANTNGAGSFIRSAISDKIVSKIFIDQPTEVLKFKTQSKYFPFPGKTESEIALIIASGLTTKFNSVLYANFGFVFSEIEYKASVVNLDFYEMEEGLQRKIIALKVSELINMMADDAQDGMASAFGSSVEADEKAKIKSSSSGVTGILDIHASVAAGTTERSAAISMLTKIYGFDEEEADAILGKPKAPPAPPQLKIA